MASVVYLFCLLSLESQIHEAGGVGGFVLFTGLSPGPRTVPDTYSQRGRRAYWKK
jgi:hypothetical protein